MSNGGMIADVELRSNLLRGVFIGDQVEYFLFARGDIVNHILYLLVRRVDDIVRG